MAKWILTAVVFASFALSGCSSGEYSTPTITSWPQPVPVYTRPAPKVAAAPSASSVPGDWIPPQSLERKSRWEGIVVHHAAIAKGNAATIDRLHKQRGWEGLGYDFVISNGIGGPDGATEVGWRWKEQREGAHTRVTGDYTNYWNERTIGICLIGNFENTKPTDAQYESLAKLVKFLQARYSIPTSKIKGHGDVDATRCPGRNFSMWKLKTLLK
jgi:N-acetylmuramoyl-L-alanine amidase